MTAEQRAPLLFNKYFGRAPRWLATAPGRVNLIGEHTDYNQGYVMPIAIDRLTAVAVGPTPAIDGDSVVLSIASESLEAKCKIVVNPAGPERRNDWTDYLLGVYAGFIARGAKPQSLDIVVASDIPIGAGLSSSAALEVALATAFESIFRIRLSNDDKALLCQCAEREFAGVPCGIMDQYAVINASAGAAMLLNCADMVCTHVPYQPGEYILQIFDSGVRHQLASGEYALRAAECRRAAAALGVENLSVIGSTDLAPRLQQLDATLAARVRHVVTENARTLAAAQALRESDWQGMGAILNAGHASLRDDYAVSCEELDLLAGLVLEAGGIGARLTGGGFGGCIVALLPRVNAAAIGHCVLDRYFSQTGIRTTMMTVNAAAGARLLQG